MKLTRALLFVKDLDRMAVFYGDILGFSAIAETRTDIWIEFETGGARLALHAIPAGIAERVEVNSPPRPRENNPLKLIFEVDNLAAEREKLEALGVPTRPHAWGACDAVDPEGNIFQLLPIREPDPIAPPSPAAAVPITPAKVPPQSPGR